MKSQPDSEVEYILRNFDLRRDEIAEIEGLRSLFRRTSQTMPFTNIDAAALSDTLQQAQYTMTIIQAHEKTFFDGRTPEKREAMIVTAILGENSMNVDSYTNDSFYKNLEQLHRYIRTDISDIGMQVSVLMEAESILDVCMMDHEWFCLHVAALNKIRDYRAGFLYLTPEDREEAADNASHLLSQFSKGASHLSRHTCEEIVKIQACLKGLKNGQPTAEIIAFPGPRQ